MIADYNVIVWWRLINSKKKHHQSVRVATPLHLPGFWENLQGWYLPEASWRRVIKLFPGSNFHREKAQQTKKNGFREDVEEKFFRMYVFGGIFLEVFGFCLFI